MATPKVLMITLDIEVGESKTHATRIRAAYAAAVEAAVEAVKKELIPGSVDRVTSRMTWGYRFLETTTSHEDITIEDWEDGADTA